MNRYISILLAGLAVASSTACHEMTEDKGTESPLRPEIIATKADYTANFCVGDSFHCPLILSSPIRNLSRIISGT